MPEANIFHHILSSLRQIRNVLCDRINYYTGTVEGEAWELPKVTAFQMPGTELQIKSLVNSSTVEILVGTNSCTFKVLVDGDSHTIVHIS